MPRTLPALIAQAGLVAGVLLTAQLAAAPKFSEWEVPANLGTTINSLVDDFGPAISKNGLSLFFTSNRLGFGGTDIWVSQRPSKDDPWGVPMNLGGRVNTTATEGPPSLSRDEHWLFFNSDRQHATSVGDQDIWVSWRPNVHDDFGWEEPTSLGTGVNSASFDAGASLFENQDGRAPQLLFVSNRPGGGGFDVYVSERASDGVFGPAVRVTELSSPALEQRPSVRFDGLEVFFHSNRPASGGNDLWVATRHDVDDPWSSPVNLGATVNSAAGDQQPYIASDRTTLFFASNRPDTLGGFDLYVTTRAKDKQ